MNGSTSRLSTSISIQKNESWQGSAGSRNTSRSSTLLARLYWEFHHNGAAKQFKNSKKWAMVGKAMSSERIRHHAYPKLDQLVIWLWPLAKKHEWTYRDL